MGVDKFNHEGYFDPTTYEALTNIHREEMAADKKAAYLPLVYVCSPYAGDVETNVKNARAYSRFAVDENAIPVTPHLLYPQFMDDGNETEREMAIRDGESLGGRSSATDDFSTEEDDDFLATFFILLHKKYLTEVYHEKIRYDFRAGRSYSKRGGTERRKLEKVSEYCFRNLQVPIPRPAFNLCPKTGCKGLRFHRDME